MLSAITGQITSLPRWGFGLFLSVREQNSVPPVSGSALYLFHCVCCHGDVRLWVVPFRMNARLPLVACWFVGGLVVLLIALFVGGGVFCDLAVGSCGDKFMINFST